MIFFPFELIVIVLRFLVGVVFVVAGGSKLLDQAATLNSVRAYKLLPERTAKIVALILPWCEGILGLLLIAGQPLLISAGLLAALLSLFTAAQIIILNGGQKINCRCFGSLDQSKTGPYTVIRNVVLLIMLAMVGLSHLIEPNRTAISLIEQFLLFLIALGIAGMYFLTHQIYQISSKYSL